MRKHLCALVSVLALTACGSQDKLQQTKPVQAELYIAKSLGPSGKGEATISVGTDYQRYDFVSYDVGNLKFTPRDGGRSLCTNAQSGFHGSPSEAAEGSTQFVSLIPC